MIVAPGVPRCCKTGLIVGTTLNNELATERPQIGQGVGKHKTMSRPRQVRTSRLCMPGPIGSPALAVRCLVEHRELRADADFVQLRAKGAWSADQGPFAGGRNTRARRHRPTA
ncbi:MAG: hypothetical protein QE285_14450 [Aquabacterium sp.]|nr:hypothetical protein [Aquabacterium sp.]